MRQPNQTLYTLALVNLDNSGSLHIPVSSPDPHNLGDLLVGRLPLARQS